MKSCLNYRADIPTQNGPSLLEKWELLLFGLGDLVDPIFEIALWILVGLGEALRDWRSIESQMEGMECSLWEVSKWEDLDKRVLKCEIQMFSRS